MDSFSSVTHFIDANDPLNISLVTPFAQVLPDDVSFLSHELSTAEPSSSSNAFFHQELSCSSIVNSADNSFFHQEFNPSSTTTTNTFLQQDQCCPYKNPQHHGTSSKIFCVICGAYMISAHKYHKHNIKFHTIIELSRAILKLKHLSLTPCDPENSSIANQFENDKDDNDVLNSKMYNQLFNYGKS